jgi:hypothetical protein
MAKGGSRSPPELITITKAKPLIINFIVIHFGGKGKIRTPPANIRLLLLSPTNCWRYQPRAYRAAERHAPCARAPPTRQPTAPAHCAVRTGSRAGHRHPLPHAAPASSRLRTLRTSNNRKASSLSRPSVGQFFSAVRKVRISSSDSARLRDDSLPPASDVSIAYPSTCSYRPPRAASPGNMLWRLARLATFLATH